MVGCGGAGQRLLENGTVNAQKSVRSLSPAWPTASAAVRIGGSTKSIQCLMALFGETIGVSCRPGSVPGRRLSTHDHRPAHLRVCRSSISMESLILAQDERWRHA